MRSPPSGQEAPETTLRSSAVSTVALLPPRLSLSGRGAWRPGQWGTWGVDSFFPPTPCPVPVVLFLLEANFCEQAALWPRLSASCPGPRNRHCSPRLWRGHKKETTTATEGAKCNAHGFQGLSTPCGVIDQQGRCVLPGRGWGGRGNGLPDDLPDG